MKSPIGVLIVDDSAFIRHTVGKHLEADPELMVVGSARDGVEALAQVASLKPDVIVLDVEMPRMDGLTALKQIMTAHPTPVVMLSSLTQQGTRTTIQALMRGAVDFVSKPGTIVDIQSVIEELKSKIKIAAGARSAPPLPPKNEPLIPRPKSGLQLLQKGDPLVVIGTSTGGPRALQQILTDLPADLPAALVVVQHMPAGFTNSLAQRLNTISGLIVQEAKEGDRLARGMALLAPGDFHLCFKNTRQVTLDDGPRRHYVRPAVDVTMESAAQHYGKNVIGIILTGMGEDGTAGAGQIKAAGGRIIAEHESTSIVHSMPGSVIKAGLADRVAPLPQVAKTLLELLGHG